VTAEGKGCRGPAKFLESPRVRAFDASPRRNAIGVGGAVGVIGVLTAVLVITLAAPEGQRGAVWRRSHRYRISPVLAALSLVLGLGATSVFVEIINPQPLPKVTLMVEGRPAIKGPLITFADGNWYVGSGPHEIRAVDARRVSSVFIVATPRRWDPLTANIFQLIRHGF
jgi:hypothetical protein